MAGFEARELEAAVAVGGAHHDGLDTPAVHPGDAAGTFALYRHAPFEGKTGFSVKNSMAASMSSTTMPALSIRLTVMMSPWPLTRRCRGRGAVHVFESGKRFNSLPFFSFPSAPRSSTIVVDVQGV